MPEPMSTAARSRVGRPAFQLSKSKITALFGVSQPLAAHRLGVSVSWLKRKCRKLGIQHWPYKHIRAHGTTCNNSQGGPSCLLLRGIDLPDNGSFHAGETEAERTGPAFCLESSESKLYSGSSQQTLVPIMNNVGDAGFRLDDRIGGQGSNFMADCVVSQVYDLPSKLPHTESASNTTPSCVPRGPLFTDVQRDKHGWLVDPWLISYFISNTPADFEFGFE